MLTWGWGVISNNYFFLFFSFGFWLRKFHYLKKENHKLITTFKGGIHSSLPSCGGSLFVKNDLERQIRNLFKGHFCPPTKNKSGMSAPKLFTCIFGHIQKKSRKVPFGILRLDLLPFVPYDPKWAPKNHQYFSTPTFLGVS